MPYNQYENEYLTVAQAAEIMCVSEKTIYNWIAQNLLKAQRLGKRCIRISPDDLHNMLKPY